MNIKRISKQQLLEQSIYVVIWLLCFLLPLIERRFALQNGISLENCNKWTYETYTLILLFFALFLVNNFLLLPWLFLKKKYLGYVVGLLGTIVLIVALLGWCTNLQGIKTLANNNSTSIRGGNKRHELSSSIGNHPAPPRMEWAEEPDTVSRPAPDRQTDKGASPFTPERHNAEHSGSPFHTGPAEQSQEPIKLKALSLQPRPIIQNYLLLSLLLLFSAGFNIAVKLFFKSLHDEIKIKDTKTQNLQYELKYLKYQINPHFFMNTLNNIHALMDIDTSKAKNTLVQLSKLMRYLLYESGSGITFLTREIKFLRNYITLMGIRYAEGVEITLDFPYGITDVQIPPLLFIPFVENAFKHGVSYRQASFIRISMRLTEGDRLLFHCVNSKHGNKSAKHHGIGLENVSKRLGILFGNDYDLTINETQNEFEILLEIPVYHEMPGNR